MRAILRQVVWDVRDYVLQLICASLIAVSSLNPRDPRPPYLQIADALKGAMDSGELPPGERLPTIRELEKQYGVAQQTVQHAFKLLRQEGRIVSWQGRGT